MTCTAVKILLAGVLILAVAANAAQHNSLIRDHNKDSRCHHPLTGYSCSASMFPILNYTLVGWFYHAPFKSCKPLYTQNGIHHCEANKDVPKNRYECENICGEPCEMLTGQGICMMEEYCTTRNTTTHHPRPCYAYGVKCCPPIADAVAAEALEYGDPDIIRRNMMRLRSQSNLINGRDLGARRNTQPAQ